MPMILTIPNLKCPVRSCASLTAESACLHLPAYADVRIIKKAPGQTGGFFVCRLLNQTNNVNFNVGRFHHMGIDFALNFHFVAGSDGQAVPIVVVNFDFD